MMATQKAMTQNMTYKAQNTKTPKKTVTLFGTLGCHLCDEAFALIKASLPTGIDVEKVDIIDSPELLDSMSERIPVMSIDSIEVNWPFSSTDIQALWTKSTSHRRYLL